MDFHYFCIDLTMFFIAVFFTDYLRKLYIRMIIHKYGLIYFDYPDSINQNFVWDIDKSNHEQNKIAPLSSLGCIFN